MFLKSFSRTNIDRYKASYEDTIATLKVQREQYDKLRKNGIPKELLDQKVVYVGSDLKYYNGYVFHYAFVGFTTPGKYLQLMYNAIMSVHLFTKHPVILYYIGDFSKADFDFSDFKRLIIFQVNNERQHVWFSKIRSAILSPVKVGHILESDSLVYSGIERLMLRIEEEITEKYPYPMMTQHWDKRDVVKGNGTIYPLDIPQSKRSMRYMHAHLSWTIYAKDFLSTLYVDIQSGKYRDDEMALNLNLWKNNLTKQWCFYDVFSDWVDPDRTSRDWNGNTAYFPYIIHGEKDPLRQKVLLKNMMNIKKANKDTYYVIDNKVYFNFNDKVPFDDKRHGCII